MFNSEKIYCVCVCVSKKITENLKLRKDKRAGAKNLNDKRAGAKNLNDKRRQTTTGFLKKLISVIFGLSGYIARLLVGLKNRFFSEN